MANIQISQLGDGGALQNTDQIPIVRGSQNYKITGDNFVNNDLYKNLIFNSEFYDTRGQATVTGTNTQYWNGDGSTIFWTTNAAFLFYGSIFIENGSRVARLRVDDSANAPQICGRNLYIDEAQTIALRGKTVTASSWVRLGTNWNTTNGQGALRMRAGYTTAQGLVGEVNGDLSLKQALGTTTFIGTAVTGLNPLRNTWIKISHTFAVPVNAFNLVFTYDGFVVAGDQLVTNKLGDPAFPETFYFDVKEPQLTITNSEIPYKPTGYVEANATSEPLFATQTEYFNKDNTKPVNAENIANDIRQASFSIVNKSYNGTQQTDFGDSATWLTTTAPQLIPTGDETLDGGSFVAGLNLLETMLDTNETTYNDLGDYSGFQFKDTVNAQLNGTGRWFNNTDKKWLAPSPLYTFGENANKKLFFTIRIPELMITTQNSFNGNAMYLYVRLLRYNFNAQNRKIISLIPITLSEIGATANIPYTFLYSTNIKGETDPYVSAGNGFYMDIIKSDKSTAGGGNPAYLRHVRIDIERN